MARIRSIHPAIHTDEAFMALSHGAFRLYIGLLGEADDQGVFEWKPLTLKARILPAHADNADTLLAELVAQNLICKFEHAGKAYGAIRNFLRYQKPRRPSVIHTLPESMAEYVCKRAAQDGEIPDTGGNDPPSGGDNPDKSGRTRADGEGEGEGKGKKYQFKGAVVRLTEADYQKWKRAYSAIPDLDAELHRIDDTFRVKPVDNWFMAASNMLAAKHQKLSAVKPQAPPKPRKPQQAEVTAERDEQYREWMARNGGNA